MSGESDFQEFFREAFPAVSPESRAKVKSYLVGDKPLLQWMYKPRIQTKHPVQGDIVENLPLYIAKSDGLRQAGKNFPAILLEHTCDMALNSDGTLRARNYSYAPLLPLANISDYMDVTTLKRNLITHKIHMGAVPGLDGEFVVDLNITCSVDAGSFHDALGDGVQKVTSLSNDGFFFFLAKISAHFLRADDRLDHPDR